MTDSPLTGSPLTGSPAPGQVKDAMIAVYVVFIGSGFAFASWASRIPQVRDRLRVDPGELGLILLATAIGSIIAMPLAGVVVTRLGSARAVTVMSLILVAGLATTAVGYLHGIPPVVVGLFFLGFGNGTWDVAMNLQGAVVEQHLGRAIMPRFHAGFSVGTVAGALGGSAMIFLHVPVTAHLLLVAVIIAATVPAATRKFIPAAPRPATEAHHVRRSPFKAWTEARTLLIGVFVLCMAFTEGTGNDWLGVAMVDGYHTSAAVGSLTFALFVGAMTTGRWFGPGLIDRLGRVAVLRGSALTAAFGLVVVVFSQTVPTAMIGAVLWGLGAALGFPVGMSAASDDPRHAAGRVSTVASIGYAAFLAGPPLIGFLGNHGGVLQALTVTAGLLALAAALAGACRPPEITGSDQAGVGTAMPA